MTWVANGETRTGPALPYTRIEIDGDERDAERIAFSSRGRSSIRFDGGEPSRRSPSAELRSSIPDDVFSPYKPPFTVRRVLVAPTGEVWIPRVGRWNDTSTIIDVIDRGGHLVRRINVPAGRRIVGLAEPPSTSPRRTMSTSNGSNELRCANRRIARLLILLHGPPCTAAQLLYFSRAHVTCTAAKPDQSRDAP